MAGATPHAQVVNALRLASCGCFSEPGRVLLRSRNLASLWVPCREGAHRLGQDGGRRHGATLGATLGAALSPTAVPGLRGAAVGWRRLLGWGARVGFVPSVLGLPAFPPKLTKRRGPGLVGLGCLLQMSRRQDPRELPSWAV